VADKGTAVAAGAAGILFLYAAVSDKSVLTVVKDTVRGKKPGPIGSSSGSVPITGTGFSGPGTGIGADPGAIGRIEKIWISNGGNPGTAFVAANVAMAESSGSETVTSGNPDGGTNVGLWQLDTKGVGAGYTVGQLQNPNLNAQLTIMATNNGVSWTQWADALVVNGQYIGPAKG
jgi:hypothetical protein